MRDCLSLSDALLAAILSVHSDIIQVSSDKRENFTEAEITGSWRLPVSCFGLPWLGL